MDIIKEEDLYSRVFHSAIVAIGITDIKGNFVTVNPTWSQYLGWTQEEAKLLNIKDVTPDEDLLVSNENLAYLTNGIVNNMRKQRRYKRKDGSIFWADLHSSTLYEDGKIIGVLGIFVDIDKEINAEQVQKKMFQDMEALNLELSSANEDLQRLARYDALTGLFNRRVMEELLTKESSRAFRTKRGFGVAIADIDDFKRVNDTFGHNCGDIVLIQLANIFLQNVRMTDTVGRWGGEEFLFILTETSVEGSIIAMERIRRAVEAQIFEFHNNPIEITITIGLSFHYGDPTSKEIVNQADEAMYKGKKIGKNKVINYYNSVYATERKEE
ncbi:MAG: diguanylate cyclase [Candidatus Cloacimonas sp.]